MKLPQQRAWMLSVLGLVISASVGLQRADVAEAKQPLHQACPFSDPSMNPKHEVLHEHDFVWQIPPRPRAVLLLAHGAKKDAFGFFDRGPGCQLCYGRPEDRTAVLGALQQGYAVLAPKSKGWIWDVWPLESDHLDSWPLGTDDLDFVTELVKSWTREHNLEHLPLLGWGHSFGGWFLSSLSFRLSFQALVLMCSEGMLGALKLATPGQFPPTFFVHMLTDDDTTTSTAKLALAMATLIERGIPVKERIILRKPLTPTFLSEGIDCMTENISSKIYGAFRAEGTWLDAEDYIIKSLLHNDWRPVVLKWNALSYCEELESLYLEEQVDQELNVARGYHSFTREANSEIFSWLNSEALSSFHASV